MTEKELSEMTILCPVCESQMNITMEPYADSLDFPTGTCPECGVSAMVDNLEDDAMRKRIFRYQMRVFLGDIAKGERAKDLVNLHPLFPRSRIDQLIAMMDREIPPPISHAGNKSLPPLSGEEIDLVRQALDL